MKLKMYTQDFPTFCAGAIATGGVVESLEDYKEQFASLVRQLIAVSQTGVVMADNSRAGYNGPWCFMDWLKEREGEIIPVESAMYTVGYDYPQPKYTYATLDVKIEQVVITDTWRNKNSGNQVRMCILVINYDRLAAYDHETINGPRTL